MNARPLFDVSIAAGCGGNSGCGGRCALGELCLKLGYARIGVDGELGLLLEQHGGHKGVLGVDHDEGDVHLAAASLLGEKPGLDVVSVDERLLCGLVK